MGGDTSSSACGHAAGLARGVSAAAGGGAAEVGYSAQVLFQELRRRGYGGSYETVKRFVRPLRETQLPRGGDADAVRDTAGTAHLWI